MLKGLELQLDHHNELIEYCQNLELNSSLLLLIQQA